MKGEIKMDSIECQRLSNLTSSEWVKVKAPYVPVKYSKNYNLRARMCNLVDVKKILDEAKILFWLDGGALLGAYRDNDWISYDDDIDLTIFEEDWRDQVAALRSRFINCGFIVHESGNKVSRLTLFREREQIGLYGWYLDSSYEEGKYRLRPTERIPVRFFENKKYMEFKGMTFCIPNPTEEYFVWRYGENWRIPMIMFETKEWTSGNKSRNREHWREASEPWIRERILKENQ